VLPELERAIRAHRDKATGDFYIPDEEARSLGHELVVQIVPCGSVRTPCTFDWLAALRCRACFDHVLRCAFGETRGASRDLASLDDRPRASLCSKRCGGEARATSGSAPGGRPGPWRALRSCSTTTPIGRS